MNLSRRLLLNRNLSRGLHTTPVVELRKLPKVVVNIDHEFHKVIKFVPPDGPKEVKPWDPRRSCDLRPMEPIDPNWLRLEFRPFAEQIEKLPEHQRRMFTVEFAGRRSGTEILLRDTLDKVVRHKYDNSSLDFKIAWSTWRIRNVQDLFQNDEHAAKNGYFRNRIKELVEKRKKWLNQMRHADYKRFEWIIEVLGLVYKLPPPYTKIERITAINVLVNMYCNELRDKKMAEYKALLEEEKVPFLKTKLETLQVIRADEESVGLQSSVDDEIQATRKLLQELEKSHLTIHPSEIKNARHNETV